MPDLMYQIALWFNLATGAAMLVLGLANFKPHNWMAISLAATELLLIAQLAVTTYLVIRGASAATDTVEFYAYIITALLIPPAAVFWALIERNSRWSTVVMAVAALSIAVMLVRMHQIWTGHFN
jgi:hypothetical protein